MRTILGTQVLLAAAALVAGCGGSQPSELAGGSGSSDVGLTSGAGGASSSGDSGEDGLGGGGGSAPTALDDRVVDYNEALRTASLKLVSALPTLEQIQKVAKAKDKKKAYLAELDAMFADVRFQERMIKLWKDIMRQGGGANGDAPSRDTAPTFAARVVVEGRPYTDLFTASSGTCPSYDYDAHQFVDGDCDNGVAKHAGVLTNPGVMYQFYGNMAFRRVRWVQEIFVCTKFPTEYSDAPVQKGAGDYVSPWPFESIATAPIDFQDTQSVICANCHTTMNHIAPLFGHFDKNGTWRDSIQVETPLTPDPVKTQLSHWLQDGEKTAWRLGQEVADLPELGQAMAADPDVSECAVARAWNFAMSKEDIVSDLATVPPEVIQPYVDAFQSNGMDFEKTLRAIFASDDFVRF